MKQLFYIVFLIPVIAFSQKFQVKEDGIAPINRDSNGNFISERQVLKNDFEKIEGTYQIQVSKPNYSVFLSESLFDKIQSARKEYEDVFLVLDEFSKLYLPSIQKIKSSGFKKLETLKFTIN